MPVGARTTGSPKRFCRRGDLLGIALLRSPRQPQRIARVTWNHVNVEVIDRLPGGLPTRVEQVDAVSLETVRHGPRQPLRREHGRLEVLGFDLEQITRVAPGNHQRVAAGGRADVHEGNCPLVLSMIWPGISPAMILQKMQSGSLTN